MKRLGVYSLAKKYTPKVRHVSLEPPQWPEIRYQPALDLYPDWAEYGDATGPTGASYNPKLAELDHETLRGIQF